MAEFDHKEYARQMRENCAKDQNGNIICSAELWEQIANIIENTADVVPKNEVEALKDDNKFLQDRRFKELSEVRQEVAREIFEEIEKVFTVKYPMCTNPVLVLDSLSYAELKKKYTEGEHNE